MLACPAPAYHAMASVDPATIDRVFGEMATRVGATARATVEPERFTSPAQLAVELALDSLDATSEQAWLDYWRGSARLTRFNALADATVAMVRPEIARGDLEKLPQPALDRLVEHFPSLHDVLCFADHTIRRAGRLIGTMIHREVTDPGRRTKDAAYAQAFNWNYDWYRVATTTLNVSSSGPPPPTVAADLIHAIADFAKEAAVRAYHEASNGRRLREEDEADRGIT